MEIFRETLKLNGKSHSIEGRDGKSRWSWNHGTIEIQFGGKRLTVACEQSEYGIYLSGFVGRYETSNKAWPASVTLHEDGRVSASFGRDDRSGRFHKLRGISYEPNTYAAIVSETAVERLIEAGIISAPQDRGVCVNTMPKGGAQ